MGGEFYYAANIRKIGSRTKELILFLCGDGDII
jgi:hypothetical protein